jgi:hypothetical protein
MRPRFAYTAIVLGVGFSLLAGGQAWAQGVAEILATGGQFGGPSQTTAHCYVFNAGNFPVIITSAVIRNQAGAAYTGTDTCTAAYLFPNATCNVDVAISATPGLAVTSCTIELNNDGSANLRGIMDIRDSSGDVLINSILR